MPRFRGPKIDSLPTFYFDRISLNNVTLITFFSLTHVGNRFNLLISSEYSQNHLLNLKLNPFFVITLVFLTHSHYLTSKFIPQWKPQLSINHSTCFINHLTSRNNLLRDYNGAQFTEKAINLNENNFLTILRTITFLSRLTLASIKPTFLGSWGILEFFCTVNKPNYLSSENRPNLKMKKWMAKS